MNDDAPDQVISRQLGSGERLLWSGKPRQGVMLRPTDAFFIPFSLLWCGFAIVWEAGVIRGNAPIFMQFWGIPFVVVGLYFVFGRFWVDARQRSQTSYGLTNQRIIIVSGLFSQQVKSLNLRTLADLSLTERSNGFGTISFGTPPPWWVASNMQWPGMSGRFVPMFDGIENPRTVYEQIRGAQAAA